MAKRVSNSVDMKLLQPKLKVLAGLAKPGRRSTKINGVKIETNNWNPTLPPIETHSMMNVTKSKAFVQNFIKHRSANGKFKERGDVYANSPSGWARTTTLVTGSSNSFKTTSTSSFLETTNATDLDVKMVTSTAIPDSVVLAREDHRDRLHNACLYCQHPDYVKNAERIGYKQKVATIVLNHVRQPKLNAWNTKHFPRGHENQGGFSDEGSNMWQLVYIQLKYLMVYDDIDIKVNDDDFYPFTDAERSEIKHYFTGWLEHFESLFKPKIIEAFPGFYSGDFSQVQRTGNPLPMFYQHNGTGTPITKSAVGYQRYLNNRRGLYKCYQLYYAIKFGTGNGRIDAYRWIHCNLRFNTWSNGDFAEQHRMSTGEPAEGLQYTSANLSEMLWMTVIAAKKGWMEFYNDFWVTGITAGLNGTESVTPKTLKTILMNLASYAKPTPTYNRYASSDAAKNQVATQKIRLYNIGTSGKNVIIDTYCAAQISPLAQDPDVEKICLRDTSLYYPFQSNDQGIAANNAAFGFRGLYNNIYFEEAGRGSGWHPITNPCDFVTLLPTAYNN